MLIFHQKIVYSVIFFLWKNLIYTCEKSNDRPYEMDTLADLKYNTKYALGIFISINDYQKQNNIVIMYIRNLI